MFFEICFEIRPRMLIMQRMENKRVDHETARRDEDKTSRFLITGAKGCIGAWIVKNLVERGDQPWIFDTDSKAHRLEALLPKDRLRAAGFIQGDVTQTESLERAVIDHGITHIIHLAALQVPACAANPIVGAQVNVIGTLNVFEVARRHRKNMQRADHVYLSTQYWICSAGGNLECRQMDDMSDAMVDHRAFQALRLRHITLDETSSAKPVLGKERLKPVSL